MSEEKKLEIQFNVPKGENKLKRERKHKRNRNNFVGNSSHASGNSSSATTQNIFEENLEYSSPKQKIQEENPANQSDHEEKNKDQGEEQKQAGRQKVTKMNLDDSDSGPASERVQQDKSTHSRPGSSAEKRMTPNNESQQNKDLDINAKDGKKENSQQNVLENENLNEDNQNPKQNRNKIIIGAVVSSTVIAVIIILSVVLTLPQKVDPLPSNSTLIINRALKPNQVFQISASLKTQSNSKEIQNPQIIKINYSLIFVVVSQTSINSQALINLGAVVQKRSEEIVSEDKESVKITMFDESDIYSAILEKGVGSLKSNTENSDDANKEKCADQFINESDSRECVRSVLPVFTFTIQQNGDLVSLNFPEGIDHETISLTRSFISIFSPKLDRQLYQQSSNLRNSETNEESIHYSAEITHNRRIILTSKGQSRKKDASLNKKQTYSTQTTFTLEGKLLSASSSSIFYLTDDNSENDNKAFNLEVNQQCSFQVNETKSTSEYVGEFSDFFKKYEKQGKIMKMKSKDLDSYIMGNYGENEEGRRMLVKKEGQFQVMKEDLLFQASIIGFPIKVYGYTQIIFQEQQYQFNKYSHKIGLDWKSGALLKLGTHKLYYPISNISQQLHPLPIKYTLASISELMTDLSPSLLTEIIDLSFALVTSDQFALDISPKVEQILEDLDEISKQIKIQHDRAWPENKISLITEKIRSLEQLMSIKVISAFQADISIFEGASQQLQSYINITFQNLLQNFDEEREQLVAIRSKTLNYLSIEETYFLARNISDIEENIDSLVSDMMQDKYEEQMNKTEPILQMIEYVREEGKNYLNISYGYIQEMRSKLLEGVEKVLGVYFGEEQAMREQLKSLLNEANSQIQTEYQSFESQLDFLNSLDDTSITFLTNITTSQVNDIDDPVYLQNFTQMIDDITLDAQGAANQRFDRCCQWVSSNCVTWNQAEADQQAQPRLWTQTKQSIYPECVSIFQSVTYFISNTTDILNDSSNLTIPQRYSLLTSLFNEVLAPHQQSVSFNNSIITLLSSHINNVSSTLSSVSCGQTAFLESLLSNLNILKNFLEDYFEKVSQYIPVAQEIINTFNISMYQTIQQQSVIIESGQIFMEEYREWMNNVSDIVGELENNSQNYDVMEFVQNVSMLDSLQMIDRYRGIGEYLQSRCHFVNESNLLIVQMREQFLKKWKKTKDLSDTVLDNQLQSMINFLNSSSTHIFNSYLQTDFCLIYSTFKQNSHLLLLELYNFTAIYSLWNQFTNIQNSADSFIQQIQANWDPLESILEQLFTQKQFYQHISYIQSIASNITDFFWNISLSLSHFKQQSYQLSLFQLPDPSELFSHINAINSIPMTLAAGQTYPQISSYKDESIIAAQSIIYDVIAAVLINKNIQFYSSNSIQQFRDGLAAFKQAFLNVVQQFIFSTWMDSQQHLDSINYELNTLMYRMDEMVFQNITSGASTILQKFKSYQFLDKQMQKVSLNGVKRMIEFGVKMREAQQNLLYEMRITISDTTKITNQLSIDSFSKMRALQDALSTKIHNFIAFSKQQVNRLDQFIQSYEQDIHHLLQNNLTLLYQSTYQNINKQLAAFNKQNSLLINQTLQYLSTSYSQQLYPQFLQTFTPIFSPFQIYNTSSTDGAILVIKDIGDLNITQLVSTLLKQTQGLIAQIQSDEGRVNYLYEHIDMYKQLHSIKQSITDAKLIQKINHVYAYIKRKVTIFENMKFCALITELEQLSASVTNVSTLFNTGIMDQLAYVNNLTALSTYSSELQALIDTLSSDYNILIDLIPSLNYLKGKSMLSQLLQEQFTSELNDLRLAYLEIMTVTVFQNPIQTQTIIDQQIQFGLIPTEKFEQVISTSLGGIKIQVEISLNGASEILFQLLKTRNIKTIVNQTFALSFQAQVKSGLSRIYELGVILHEDGLFSSSAQQGHLNDIYPIQLVPSISNFPKIRDQNIITVGGQKQFQVSSFTTQLSTFTKKSQLQSIFQSEQFCLGTQNNCHYFDIWSGISFTNSQIQTVNGTENVIEPSGYYSLYEQVQYTPAMP